jgi:catechol 2,3-dioxygenase-like lactoylglutathione lyase family enzyme
MEVLSSRVLLHPTDLVRSQTFYRETLGLAVYREFGSPDAPGIVFFVGNGLLEVSGRATAPPSSAMRLWLQVRDVAAEQLRLRAAGVTIVREARLEPWGLTELWISDPDDVMMVLVEVPEDHPVRRDPRDPHALG